MVARTSRRQHARLQRGPCRYCQGHEAVSKRPMIVRGTIWRGLEVNSQRGRPGWPLLQVWKIAALGCPSYSGLLLFVLRVSVLHSRVRSHFGLSLCNGYCIPVGTQCLLPSCPSLNNYPTKLPWPGLRHPGPVRQKYFLLLFKPRHAYSSTCWGWLPAERLPSILNLHGNTCARFYFAKSDAPTPTETRVTEDPDFISRSMHCRTPEHTGNKENSYDA